MKCNKEDILKWQKQGLKLGLLDIREFYETPEIDSNEVEHVPMGELLDYNFNQEIIYVLICNSGNRSTAAVMEIIRLNPKVNIYSLEGGVHAYLN